ncbi:ubiquitin-like protein 3 isoform X3 [Anomalospiza imberbis]|uniref:ubiquitin-like protein 3 isoform X3 n=1 Tax=Anomalospiza imberbis TaxID=187417 RepID=UPI00358FCE26
MAPVSQLAGVEEYDLGNLRMAWISRFRKQFAYWEEEQVSSPNILRLIYQGRFLHGNVTLGALKLPFGKTTVMHLVARETLPEPNSQGQRNREKTGESNCCVIL